MNQDVEVFVQRLELWWRNIHVCYHAELKPDVGLPESCILETELELVCRFITFAGQWAIITDTTIHTCTSYPYAKMRSWFAFKCYIRLICLIGRDKNPYCR